MEEMNEKFYKDPYLKEFDTEAVSCEPGKNGYEVILKDTIFYPEGGGQPGDRGTINDVKVLDTKRINGEVVHITEKEVIGKVHCVLDWDRRFDHMQQHTGEHIFSGMVHKYFGYENVGFHMGEKILVDFNGTLQEKDIEMLEREANQTIWNNNPIEVSFPNEEELRTLDYRSKKELSGKVRIVSIPSADICACCGTHVMYTGEVGLIKVLSFQKHKNGTRVEIVCGGRAFRQVCHIYNENQKISHLLSAPVDQTAMAVESLLENRNALQRRLSVYAQASLEKDFSEIRENEPFVLLFTEGADRNEIRRYANRIIDEKKAGTAAYINLEDNGNYSYLILSNTVPLREVGKVLNERLNGKGGGRDTFLQGSFQAEKEEIKKVMEEIFHA